MKRISILLLASVLVSAAAMAETLELTFAAALGTHINGSDGSARGALQGFGASLFTPGEELEAPAGTLLEFRLRHSFTTGVHESDAFLAKLEQWQKENGLEESLTLGLVGSSRRTRARALEELREHYRLTRGSLSYARLWGVKDKVHP